MAVACGLNAEGQCDLPAPPAGQRYSQVAAGGAHSVLLTSEGTAAAYGRNNQGQCDFPVLPEGQRYTQVSAGHDHTALLTSDGAVVLCGCRNWPRAVSQPMLGDAEIDAPRAAGQRYTQVSAGGGLWPHSGFSVRLRSDGEACFKGYCPNGENNIPALPEGLRYTHVSAGHRHIAMLRSDGMAVACGRNDEGQCDLPAPPAGLRFVHVSAGETHTVLLKSDGTAVACGRNTWGQCDLPTLPSEAARLRSVTSVRSFPRFLVQYLRNAAPVLYVVTN
jgi:alpha-tubulin suppressor-like RCC1 family protein